ncbi:hypothetical protein DPMN_016712 [Dreissena polymorpha]|uniref:Uncharacterized protein n=1 Tax=Dreissena polymorpha TaxID=45954 RepID=A0A9D4S5R6_DREPO|nr:hypothetical protein DPMN_016712 [Dreissena polymorpha]
MHHYSCIKHGCKDSWSLVGSVGLDDSLYPVVKVVNARVDHRVKWVSASSA